VEFSDTIDNVKAKDSREGGLKTPLTTIIGKTSCSRLVVTFPDKFLTRGSLARQVSASHDKQLVRTSTLRLRPGHKPYHVVRPRHVNSSADTWDTGSPCHASAPAGGTRGHLALTGVLMQLCPTAHPSTRHHMPPRSTQTPPKSLEYPL
jgi:hypothetical protein